MKIEIETDDFEVIEEYKRKDGHRDWGERVSTWLYPGDIIVLVDGESAKKLCSVLQTQSDFNKGTTPH